MIFCLWVNPWIRHRAFNSADPNLSQAGLARISMDLFEQIFGTVADDEFWDTCNEYYYALGEFLDEAMSLKFVEKRCSNKVCYMFFVRFTILMLLLDSINGLML